MGQIIVDRESNYAGVLAQYDIYLDGNKIGSVANGKVVSFEIPEGIHKMYAKNGIIAIGKSNEIEFKMTENKKIKIFMKSVMSSMSGIKLEIIEETSNVDKDEEQKYDKLEKLNDLKNKNIISEAEFEKEKQKILKGE